MCCRYKSCFSLNNFCLILLKEKQKMVLHWSTNVTPQENWWCNESSSLKEKTAKVLQVSQHSLSHCGEKLLSFQSNIVNITMYYTTFTLMINFNELFLLSDRKTQVCLISCSFTENNNIDWQLPLCVYLFREWWLQQSEQHNLSVQPWRICQPTGKV